MLLSLVSSSVEADAEIDKLKAQIEKLTSKTVNVNIMEVKTPDTNAQLVAENIAAQLERRNFIQTCNEASYGQSNASWR